jgi:hypothetical protein
MASGGRFVITMPAVSYARELWRLGEPELARRAAAMSPGECAEVGERAGHLHLSGDAARLWPAGPRGVAAATMLAVVEHSRAGRGPAHGRGGCRSAPCRRSGS